MSDVAFAAGDVSIGAGADVVQAVAGEGVGPFQPVTVGGGVAWLGSSAAAASAAVTGLTGESSADGQPVAVVTEGEITITTAPFVAGVTYALSPNVGKVSPLSDLASDDFVTILGRALSTSVFRVGVFASGGVFTSP